MNDSGLVRRSRCERYGRGVPPQSVAPPRGRPLQPETSRGTTPQRGLTRARPQSLRGPRGPGPAARTARATRIRSRTDRAAAARPQAALRMESRAVPHGPSGSLRPDIRPCADRRPRGLRPRMRPARGVRRGPLPGCPANGRRGRGSQSVWGGACGLLRLAGRPLVGGAVRAGRSAARRRPLVRAGLSQSRVHSLMRLPWQPCPLDVLCRQPFLTPGPSPPATAWPWPSRWK